MTAARTYPPEHYAALSRMPREGKALTWRERAVLRLVAEGLTNKEIARALAYSPGTVATMLQRINAKLGTSNRAGMVDRGWRKGYLGPADRS